MGSNRRKEEMKPMIRVLSAVLLLSTMAMSQEQKPDAENPAETPRAETAGSLYRVAVSVNELDGETKVNSRGYTVMTRPQGPGQPHQGQLRVGSRVPVQTSKDAVQYMDVGMKIDVFNAREAQG